MNSANSCKYVDSYFDINNENVEYSCIRKSSGSGYCIFHDPDFLTNETEDEVRKLFLSELHASIAVAPLVCVGFYLPEISIKNLKISEAYFINTKFQGDVNFFNVTFDFVSFSGAKFAKSGNFTNLEFNDNFIFSDVEFLENSINFRNVHFRKKSSFARSRLRDTSVIDCSFDIATFRSTVFINKVLFEKSNFDNKVDFTDTQFNESDFSFSTFSKNANFQYSKFGKLTKFCNVDFKEQKLVFFDGDLSNVSFKDSDITRIKFDEKIIWGKSDKYEIYDARELIKNPNDNSLGYVLSIYRNLRENYEFRLMYEEAGQFFIREMELKRNYREDPDDYYKTKRKSKLYRYASLTSFYSYLCQYGENFGRPILWTCLVLLFAFVYNWNFPDFASLAKTHANTNINYTGLIINDNVFRSQVTLERTLSSYFQIESNDLLDYLERIVSIPILGSLLIVLRRRFERRFRH